MTSTLEFTLYPFEILKLKAYHAGSMNYASFTNSLSQTLLAIIILELFLAFLIKKE